MGFFSDLLGTSKRPGGIGSFFGGIVQPFVEAIPGIGKIASAALNSAQARAAQKRVDAEQKKVTAAQLAALTGPGLIDNRIAKKASRNKALSPVTRELAKRVEQGAKIIFGAPTTTRSAPTLRQLPGGSFTTASIRPGVGRTSVPALSTSSNIPRRSTIVPRSSLPVLKTAGDAIVNRMAVDQLRGFSPAMRGPGITSGPTLAQARGRATVAQAGIGTGLLQVAKEVGRFAVSEGASRALASPALTTTRAAERIRMPAGRPQVTERSLASTRIRGALETTAALEKFGVDPFTGILQPTTNGLLMTERGPIRPLVLFRFDPRRDAFIKIKKRRMNPLNFKALKRANSRQKSFEKIVLSNFRCEESGRTLKPRKRKVGAKRRR